MYVLSTQNHVVVSASAMTAVVAISILTRFSIYDSTSSIYPATSVFTSRRAKKKNVSTLCAEECLGADGAMLSGLCVFTFNMVYA